MKQILNIDGKEWELIGTQACKGPNCFEVMLFFLGEDQQRLRLDVDMRKMLIKTTITEKP